MEYFAEEEEYLHSETNTTELSSQEQQQDTPSPVSIRQFLNPSVDTVRTTVIMLLLAVILLLFYFHSSQPRSLHIPTTTSFPKIFWLYTRNQPQAQQMFEQVMINYYMHYFTQRGYEVRLVNSWTAYDWLRQQIVENITRTMQNVKIDVGVDELLILGLLIEHGGVFIRNYDTVLLNDLQFIENGFNYNAQDHWSCHPSQAKIFMTLQEVKEASLPRYSDSFIAAKPNSVLLEDSLQLYMQIMTTVPVPTSQYFRLLEWNQNTEIYTAKNLMQHCLSITVENKNSFAHQHAPPRKEQSVCQQVGLQVFKDNNPIIDTASVPEGGLIEYLVATNKTSCKKYQKMLINIGNDGVKNFLRNILRQQNTVSVVEKGSILYSIISVKGNKEIFIDSLPERDIWLCIVTLQPLTQTEIESSLTTLKKQDFNNWTALYFTESENHLAQEQDEKKVKLIKNSGNRGRNIQIALTQYCSHQSFALLLNQGEEFQHNTSFTELAAAVQSRQILGAFIPLKFKGSLMVPRSAMGRFYRKEDAILNPKIDLMKNISNHLRVFSVEVFKFLPQFDLRDSYGFYYQDRIIFLMSFLDMIRQEITKAEQLYVIRKYANTFNVPRKVILLESTILKTEQIDEIDMDQMKRTFTRIETESMHINIESLLYFKIPFQKMIVFNEGKQYIPFDKKQGKPLMPAIIHQAWLGGELPPVKAYFYKKTGIVYPSYELKLWKLQNITKENFPNTYQILKNLEQFNKKSPFNKFATMTDILRHEALFRFGGFWKDAAMNFLRPVFDHFRKYQLTLATDKTLRHRWLQGMCFFGNVKEYPPLGRINNYKHLNRMRIYTADPMDIAGPVDFRQLIIGAEEYDPESLILSYQTFYPAQLGQHPAGDLCSIPQSEGIEQDFQVVQKEFGVLKNCSSIYPYAFGIEHNRFGVSWLFRKR